MKKVIKKRATQAQVNEHYYNPEFGGECHVYGREMLAAARRAGLPHKCKGSRVAVFLPERKPEDSYLCANCGRFVPLMYSHEHEHEGTIIYICRQCCRHAGEIDFSRIIKEKNQ